MSGGKGTIGMNRSSLLRVLADVQTGALTPEAASDALAHLPFEDAGFATIDHHRSLRSDMPEVIFASGKTAEQTSEIFHRLARTGVNVLFGDASVRYVTLKSFINTGSYRYISYFDVQVAWNDEMLRFDPDGGVWTVLDKQ